MSLYCFLFLLFFSFSPFIRLHGERRVMKERKGNGKKMEKENGNWEGRNAMAKERERKLITERRKGIWMMIINKSSDNDAQKI